MEELIKIEKRNEIETVSGRELHDKLGINAHYKDWIKRMIAYGFEENKDYILVAQKRATNNPKNPFTIEQEHYVSIDMAKEICMIQRSDIGKQFRQYFIECEKKLNEVSSELKTQYVTRNEMKELIDYSTQKTVAQMTESLMKCIPVIVSETVKETLKATNTKVLTQDRYSIVAYGSLRDYSVDFSTARKLGVLASKYSREHGLEITTVPDERFGKVNSYKIAALDYAFSEVNKQNEN